MGKIKYGPSFCIYNGKKQKCKTRMRGRVGKEEKVEKINSSKSWDNISQMIINVHKGAQPGRQCTNTHFSLRRKNRLVKKVGIVKREKMKCITHFFQQVKFLKLKSVESCVGFQWRGMKKLKMISLIQNFRIWRASVCS